MDSETFRPRKPAIEETQPSLPPDIGRLPGPLQHALRQNARKAEEPREEETPHQGPRLAFTGNSKLDELLAGIKDQVHRYEEKTLPSRGKFYDGTVAPSNGVIHVRCMTGEEEQILATPRYIKKGQAINMIFKNCVREPIIPEKLLTMDRTWLLIFLRGISYGPDYEVEVRCTECGTKFPSNIDLDTDLQVNYCKNDYGPENLKDVLPKSGYSISYRLPTGKDENMIQDYRDKRIKKNADDESDDTWNYRASLLINDIEGMAEKDALQVLIRRLPIQDVSYIRTLLNDQSFGVDTKVEIACPSCSEGFKVEMPMDTNFFFPKAKRVKHTLPSS